MKKITIYTNGKSLFTLENYDKTSGVSHVHGITLHSEVSQLMARSMHEKGQLFFIFGEGDRKELSNVQLSKKTKLNNFEIY
jgi:hypothetical protein